MTGLTLAHMNMANQRRLCAAKRVGLWVFGALGFYIITVGSLSAISRHMTDGRLQWVPDSLLVAKAMEIYEWPTRYLTFIPPVRWLLEAAADVWCAVTDAPETTG